MVYRALADAVFALHLGFIAFAVLGAFCVLSRPRLAWLHVPAAIWAALIEFFGWICPLTPLENALLRRAGESGYDEGFVAHYLIPLIYPAGLTPRIQLALGLGVLGLNAALYAGIMLRARAARAAS